MASTRHSSLLAAVGLLAGCAQTGLVNVPDVQLLGGSNGMQYVGDRLAVTIANQDPNSPVTVTVASGVALENPGTEVLRKTMTVLQLAYFHPKFDATDMPGLPDVPVQQLRVSMDLGNDGGSSVTFSLVKDRTAQQAPYVPLAHDPYVDASNLDASLEKYATAIATNDWKGSDLTVTSREATSADWVGNADFPQIASINPVANTKARLYEITGTFPNLFMSGDRSGTGHATVSQPGVVRVILGETNEMLVYSDRGYEK